MPNTGKESGDKTTPDPYEPDTVRYQTPNIDRFTEVTYRSTTLHLDTRYLLAHSSPGIVIHCTKNFDIIIEDVPNKTKIEVPHSAGFSYEGLPVNKLALISNNEIRIIDVTTGKPCYPSIDVRNNIPSDVLGLHATHASVSIDNNYLLVSFAGFREKTTKERNTGFIAVIEIATGLFRFIEAFAVIDSFTLMNPHQLLVLYSTPPSDSRKVLTYDVKLINFDLKTKNEPSLQSVRYKDIPGDLFPGLVKFHGGWDILGHDYVVVTENGRGQRYYLYELIKDIQGNSILKEVREFAFSPLPKFRPVEFGKPLGNSFFYVTFRGNNPAFMEFDLKKLMSSELAVRGTTFDYESELIIFANGQLGMVWKNPATEREYRITRTGWRENRRNRSVFDVVICDLTSILNYRKQMELDLGETLFERIPDAGIIPLIAQYSGHNLEAHPNRIRFFSIEPSAPKASSVKIEVEEDDNSTKPKKV